MMFSILWFSLFAFLSGFSTSYAMLFAFRALFGIGMGGEWSAGMPLALEHWPAHLRGIASGILQSGFFWGYMLSAFTFQYIYPMFSSNPDIAWRVMFWIAVIPALLVLWIRSSVEESSVWRERHRHRSAQTVKERASLARIFRRDMIAITFQTSLLMGAVIFSYHSLTFWYPTFLRQAGRRRRDRSADLRPVGGNATGPSWGNLDSFADRCADDSALPRLGAGNPVDGCPVHGRRRSWNGWSHPDVSYGTFPDRHSQHGHRIRLPRGCCNRRDHAHVDRFIA